MSNTPSKQLTAVEWLAKQMLHPDSFNPYIEQALAMEKEQIIDSYVQCWMDDGGNGQQKVSSAEKFYNSLYGKEEEQ